MSDTYRIPNHLPRRLTISFWLWNYFYGSRKGDVFHDLEQRFVELRDRGFNTIRVDAGVGLYHSPEGKPRGAIMLQQPFKEFSTLRQLQFRNAGGRCDVLKHLLTLFDLAKRYDVFVILSSWFYLHIFWFIDSHIQDELFTLPPEKRFMFFAREYDWLISRLKDKGLHTQLAFVEIFNEINGFPPGLWGLFKAGSSTEIEPKALDEFRRHHEEALGFLRARHPDVLWAMDTTGSTVDTSVLPGNAQVWNHHMYYLWDIYFKYLESYVQKPEFDFRQASRHPVIGRFIRRCPPDIEAVRRTRNGDPHVDEGWYRRVWLYNSLKSQALTVLEGQLTEALERDVAVYRRNVEENIATVMSLRQSHFPGIPLVMGEGVTYCAHPGMRWEEKSDTYWSLIEYGMALLKKNGFWGCVPRTNSGPEDPAWTEYPDRLRHANALFLSP